MHKKVLLTKTEKFLYHGEVLMPEGFEINPIEIASKIIETYITGQKLKFCKAVDMMETYVREHIGAYEEVYLETLDFSGKVYYSNQVTKPELDINADFTLLYGVHVNDCTVHIIYEDNREKLIRHIPLTNKKFILFPSKFLHYITNEQENHHLNIIQKITYIQK